jgi:hypothetical protein
MERFLNSEKSDYTLRLIFVFREMLYKWLMHKLCCNIRHNSLGTICSTNLGKFSMDKPLTAEAMILFEITGRISAKTHLLDRVYSQN